MGWLAIDLQEFALESHRGHIALCCHLSYGVVLELDILSKIVKGQFTKLLHTLYCLTLGILGRLAARQDISPHKAPVYQISGLLLQYYSHSLW